LELTGWFLTDGSFKNQPPWKSTGVALYQSNRANPHKVARIDALFQRLGFKVNRRERKEPSDMVNWTFYGDPGKHLRDQFPKRTLTSDFVRTLSRRQAQIVLDAMILGDGTRDKDKTSFAVKSDSGADAFQMLAVSCGIATSRVWRPESDYIPCSSYLTNTPHSTGIWRITLLRRDKVQVVASQRREFTAKMPVWCPSVPNTFFVARRKGNVFITGNTPIQGTSADITKLAMVNVAHRLRETGIGHLVLVVHDELVAEVDEDQIKLAEEIMLTEMNLAGNRFLKYVPCAAEFKSGRTWS
jgi:hypothetical protein